LIEGLEHLVQTERDFDPQPHALFPGERFDQRVIKTRGPIDLKLVGGGGITRDDH
jgi:hypothetical protein